jgi:hypothetical protein
MKPHVLRLNISLVFTFLKNIKTETVSIMKSIKEIIDLSANKNSSLKDFENAFISENMSSSRKGKIAKSQASKRPEWIQLILDFGSKKLNSDSTSWENKLRTED